MYLVRDGLFIKTGQPGGSLVLSWNRANTRKSHSFPSISDRLSRNLVDTCTCYISSSARARYAAYVGRHCNVLYLHNTSSRRNYLLNSVPRYQIRKELCSYLAECLPICWMWQNLCLWCLFSENNQLVIGVVNMNKNLAIAVFFLQYMIINQYKQLRLFYFLEESSLFYILAFNFFFSFVELKNGIPFIPFQNCFPRKSSFTV